MLGGDVRPGLLLFALGSLAAFGQPATIIGTIDRLVGDEIRVKTHTKAVRVLTDARTIVSGPSPLKPGNEISVRCEANASGKLVAVKIWANVIAFSATVRYIDGDDIEVMTSSSSDSHREEHKIVHLHPDTAFSTNRNDVTVGQYLRVVGLEVENGGVDAAESRFTTRMCQS